MYKIYYLNHDYFSSEEFENPNDAIEYGKSKGFEFCIFFESALCASWSPISGIKIYK